MKLRPFQQEIKRQVRSSWDTGHRCPVMVMPTGSGKTTTFCSIVHDTDEPAIVMAHRQELVAQMSVTLGRYKIRHRVIAPDATRKTIERLHMEEFGRRWVDQSAPVAAGGVDTLIRKDASDKFLRSVKLWVPDEFHHVLRENKWGKAIALMPANSRGLGPTATPMRADGKGLGAHAHGVADDLVVGPSMRESIRDGMLCDYKIFAPPSTLNLSDVGVGADGEYKHDPLSKAVRQSSITGDVVRSYLKIAPGKLGITFAVDLAHAQELVDAYNAAGVPAALLSGETDPLTRARVMREFKPGGKWLQLVNVDVLGEGVDVPACEVVSFARPTMSFGLYCIDPETEVLTPDGWKSHEDLHNISEVVAFDPVTENARVVSVQGRVKRERYPHEGMYGIEGVHLDVCVSDQHDMLVQGRSPTCVNWVKETAEKVAKRKAMFLVPTAADLCLPDADISDADLFFLGWFLSDGGLNAHTGAIQLSQSVEKKGHVDSIREAIRACGFKYGERINVRTGVPETHRDLAVFTISKGAPRGTDKHLTGWGRLGAWVDKSLPGCYDALSRRQLLVLLKSLNLGDGYNQHENAKHPVDTLRIACGDNRRLADRLQALCVTRGLSANLSTYRSPRGVDWHTVYIKDVRTRTIAGTGDKDGAVGGKKPYARARFGVRQEQPDFVWCISNELGTLITRRNGKACIVGNCQQFGRVLRLMLAPGMADGWGDMTRAERLRRISASSKPHGIIIDHVGQWERHGLPDSPRRWTLDARERGTKSGPSDAIPLRTCLNDASGDLCLTVFERTEPCCPVCGWVPPIANRSRPEFVDGDLFELDADILAKLRGESERLLDPEVFVPPGMPTAAAHGLLKQHRLRRAAQIELGEAIELWAGWQLHQGYDRRAAYKRFFFAFGVDVATARTLGRPDAEKLRADIQQVLDLHHVVKE